MLTFKATNIIFVLLLLILVAVDSWSSLPFLIYLLSAAAYISCLFYGSYYIGSGFYMPVTCKVSTSLKKIAISFDDGPALHTRQVLQILDKYKVKAAFFCIGKNIDQQAGIIREAYEAGHIIGNHSYSHSTTFACWRHRKVLRDLERTHLLIKAATGRDICWFRPPFGVTSPPVARAVKQMNYTAIGWSIRSLDTVTRNKEGLLRRLKKQLHPGAIILFHDTRAVTVEALPLFIEYAHKQGYEIVPADKLLNLQAYAD